VNEQHDYADRARKRVRGQVAGKPSRNCAGPERSCRHQRKGAADRPEITITTEEHEVNAEAVQALARDSDIYQRRGDAGPRGPRCFAGRQGYSPALRSAH
jgi:hypothetical protein